MKKGLTLLITSILATSLFADEIELQAVGGKNFPDRKKISIYNDANTLGVRNNIFFSKNNALQLAYDRLKDVQGSKDAHRYSVNYMRIQRDNGSKIHPFFIIGGGYEDGVATEQLFMNAGLGATVELTKRINLVGEIKGIKKNKDDDFDVNTNIGLGVMFGQEPVNEVMKTDCVTEEVAPKLVKRKVYIPEDSIVIDDKVDCVK
jgi:hypothetical protein